MQTFSKCIIFFRTSLVLICIYLQVKPCCYKANFSTQNLSSYISINVHHGACSEMCVSCHLMYCILYMARWSDLNKYKFFLGLIFHHYGQKSISPITCNFRAPNWGWMDYAPLCVHFIYWVAKAYEGSLYGCVYEYMQL